MRRLLLATVFGAFCGLAGPASAATLVVDPTYGVSPDLSEPGVTVVAGLDVYVQTGDGSRYGACASPKTIQAGADGFDIDGGATGTC